MSQALRTLKHFYIVNDVLKRLCILKMQVYDILRFTYLPPQAGHSPSLSHADSLLQSLLVPVRSLTTTDRLVTIIHLSCQERHTFEGQLSFFFFF